MRTAYAVADIRVAEAALMAQLPPGTLMQRAAAGLAAVSAGLLGRSYGTRIAVLAGSGDNGGDALYAAARLAGRGACVTAIQAGSRLHADAAAALIRSGGRLLGAAEPGANEAIARADLIMDGIAGIGGHGGLREPAAGLARAAALAAAAGCLVVAADLPSGIDADSGVTSGATIRADVTVTFGALKPGLLIDPGASAAGTVELIDIGLGPFLTDPPAAAALQSADVAAILPRPGAESDKYRRGVLGVLAGSDRYTGAAVLATGGAISGGAGMVRLLATRQAAGVVRQRWPEAVITVTGPDGPAEPVTAAGRVQAWVAGPGIGTGDEAEALLAGVLASSVPVLVDADGLTILARNRGLLARQAPTLITPHAGELARLLEVDRAQIEAARLEHAIRAAAELGVTVLLKGSTTIIAAARGDGPPGDGSPRDESREDGSPRDESRGDRPRGDGPVLVNPTGTGWLATAGSGDVLSGLAGALLAQGAEPVRGAAAAAYLHGIAGRLAARDAPASAGDVLAALPAAFRLVVHQSQAPLPGTGGRQQSEARPPAA